MLEIERQLEVSIAPRARRPVAPLDFPSVTLSVMHRQRADAEAFSLHHGSGGKGIEPTAQQDDCGFGHLVIWLFEH